jgi:hypothetical protein
MTFKDGIKHSQFEIGEPMSFKCDRAYVTGDLKRFNNSLFLYYLLIEYIYYNTGRCEDDSHILTFLWHIFFYKITFSSQ